MLIILSIIDLTPVAFSQRSLQATKEEQLVNLREEILPIMTSANKRQKKEGFCPPIFFFANANYFKPILSRWLPTTPFLVYNPISLEAQLYITSAILYFEAVMLRSMKK